MKSSRIFTILILIVVSLEAQDRQFWDQAVGGRTALLGGIAVGGVRDYSATFYNPGALGFLSQHSMNFNFNMYGIKDFRFIQGGGLDIAILSDRGISKAIYNNFNLFFGVTQLL